MAKQAIRPDAFFKSLPSLVEDKKAEQKGASEEERQLYSMSRSKGWEVLSSFVDNLSSDLDNMQQEALAKGMDYEEIGKNAIVIGLTKGLLKRVINKVDDAVEACTKDEQ